MLVLVGCKKEASTPNANTENSANVKPVAQCFRYDANGSLIELELHYTDSTAIGMLNYALAEKDSNMGSFKGTFENNILIADYKFQSEAEETTRQVAFKLIDDKLVEGYGDLTEDGTHFKDVTQLQFDSKMPLSKVDCKK